MDIPFSISNVAETAIMPINADNTLTAGGAGNRMTFAAMVISEKGMPNEVLRITRDNLNATLGMPLHSSEGVIADSMRSLKEALKGGDGYVVRMVAQDAKFPVMHITHSTPAQSQIALPGDEEHQQVQLAAIGATASCSAQAFGTDVVTAEDECLALWTVDGDCKENRFITISKADEDVYGANMLHLLLTSQDSAGNANTLDEFIVSLDINAKDDMGSPAFIETVLESKSPRLRAKVGHNASLLTELSETQFIGATNGTQSSIGSNEYQGAAALLKSAIQRYTAVVGCSLYDSVAIKDLIDLCNERRIGGYFDINPRLTFAQALQAKNDLSLNEKRASFTHFPYESKDDTYGNRVCFGLSGIHFAAKAAGVQKTAPTGGWHFVPAGEERSTISRTAMRLIKGAGVPDYEAMYKARLNKIGVSDDSGLLFIDDSLTSCVRENYLRFEQVVSVSDAIGRDFYALANRIKHNPDGLTFKALNEGMTEIGDNYVATGALVTPRDPATDGKEPYKLKIEQVALDMWKITYAIAVTGSGRRFIGEPVLIK